MLTSETLTQKFAKKGMWLYIFTFAIAPIGYIVKIMLSEDLSPSEIGALYGIVSLISLLIAYSDLGVSESLNYFLPKLAVEKQYQKIKYLLTVTFLVQIIASALIGGGIYLLAPWLAEHHFRDATIAPLIQVASLFFVGNMFTHFSSSLFSALQYVRLQKGIEAVRWVTTLIGVSILFFSASGDMLSYMQMWILGVFAGALFAFVFAVRSVYMPYLSSEPFILDHALGRDFFRYSIATFLTLNVGVLLSQIDMQILISLRGTEEAGYYANYLSLIGIPFIFTGPLISFLFPVIAELSGRGDRAKISLVLSTYLGYFLIISIWVMCVFLAVGAGLGFAFFGEKFRESGIILLYSAPFIVANYVIQVYFMALAGIGKARLRLYILMIGLVINILLNILFIEILDMGARGSALAVGISWIPLAVMSWWVLRREYPVRLSYRPLLQNLLSGGAFSVLVIQIQMYLGDLTRGQTILFIGFAFLLAFCIFFVINFRLLREAYQQFRSGLR